MREWKLHTGFEHFPFRLVALAAQASDQHHLQARLATLMYERHSNFLH